MNTASVGNNREATLRLFDAAGLTVGSRVTIPGTLFDGTASPHGWVHGAIGINRQGEPVLFTEEVSAFETAERVMPLTPEMVRRRFLRVAHAPRSRPYAAEAA